MTNKEDKDRYNEFLEVYLKYIKDEKLNEENESKITKDEKTKLQEYIYKFVFEIYGNVYENVEKYKKESDDKINNFNKELKNIKKQLSLKNKTDELKSSQIQEIATDNTSKVEWITNYEKPKSGMIKYGKEIKYVEKKEPVFESLPLNYLKRITFPILPKLRNVDFSNYVLKNQLKEILDLKRIKQKDLANQLGITTPTMSNIINNRYATTIELGFRIAFTLELNFTDIFYYEEEK